MTAAFFSERPSFSRISLRTSGVAVAVQGALALGAAQRPQPDAAVAAAGDAELQLRVAGHAQNLWVA